MAESLEQMKKKRAALSGVTTKLLQKVEKSMQDTPNDVDTLEESLALLKRKGKELPLLDYDIGKAVKDKDLQEEIEISEEFKDNITTWIVRIERHLRRRRENMEEGGDNLSTVSGNMNSNISYTNKKLPRLSICEFKGDCANWLTFWAQYSSAIHSNENLSTVDKFTYLLSLLKGPAASAVAGLTLTAENYDKAVKILSDRFGRKDMVIGAHMHNLLKITPVHKASDIRELRQLYDNCEIQIRSLESLGVLSESYGALLCPILLKNIPKDIVIEFNRQRGENSVWDVSELLSLLRREVESRERAEMLTKSDHNSEAVFTKDKKEKYERTEFQKHSKSRGNLASAATFNTTMAMGTSCVFCHSNHSEENCHKIMEEKRALIKSEGRCYVCLRRNHISRYCKSRISCKYCKRRHHPSLCDQQKVETIPKNSTVVASVSQQNRAKNCVYLQTARVLALGEKSKRMVRCLLDGGSQRTFITSDISRQLNLPVLGTETLNIHVFGKDRPIQVTRKRVKIQLQSLRNPDEIICIEALETPSISSAMIPVPSQVVLDPLIKEELEVSDNLADDSEITLLIGSDYYWTIVTGEIKRLGQSVVALDTKFGWCLHGPNSVVAMTEFSDSISIMKVIINDEDELASSQLKKMWELDSLGITDSALETDDEALRHFESTVKVSNGRYLVNLPWKPNMKSELADNYSVALTRLRNLVRRFQRDPLFYSQYKEVVQEYERLGIIEPVETEEKLEERNGIYYLPHRAVLKADRSTTRLRIVFDASSHKDKEYSLNDCLLSGPNLNPDLFELLLRFRGNKIAFTADVEKAFLQIELAVEERDFTRFFWVNNPFQDELVTTSYRFTRVLFGVTSSPFLLAATIKHHIKSYEDMYPNSVQLLNDSLYVDDLIGGAKSVEEALELTSDSKTIMGDAKMTLRKWNTNSDELRDMWNNDNFHSDSTVNIIPGESVSTKVLGLAWNSKKDIFYFETHELLTFLNQRVDTKRLILKAFSRIYDPLGFLTPYTIRVKCLFQELWVRNLSWDQTLPSDFQQKWNKWCTELPNVTNITIPRFYLPHVFDSDTQVIQIHCFSDASEMAYGAVLYARYHTCNETINSSMICSKSRVAPIKKQSLPRLELLGAVISSRLAQRVKHCFSKVSYQTNFYFWTDSQIVIHWIKGKPTKYKQFVQNRTTEI